MFKVSSARRQRKAYTAVGLALCAALVAGCSATSSSTGSSGTDSAAGTNATAPSTFTADQLSWATKFTGGTSGAADSSKSPVVVGYVNQEGGTLSFPEATASADATTKFINEKLGGIDGHPLVLRKCLVASPDNIQQCGTQMANDAAVKAVLVPLLLLNNATFYNAIGGKKPIIDGALIFPVDFTSPNIYSYLPGGPVGPVAVSQFFTKTLGVKRVAVVRTDNPAGLAASQSDIAQLKAAGAKAIDIPVPEPGTAPQYTAAIRAANLRSGDGVQLSLTSIGCATSYDALKSLPVKVSVVAAEICGSEPMPGHLKDLGLKNAAFPDGWYMTTNGYTPYMPQPDSNGADVFVTMIQQYANSTNNLHGFAPTAFAGLMDLTKFITEAGGPDATSAQISAKAKSFAGPAALAAGDVKCGAMAAAPNLCVFGQGFEQYKNGQWVSVADGINGKFINALSALS
jgi:branched-chain amino acid transport system substrate-binding protein